MPRLNLTACSLLVLAPMLIGGSAGSAAAPAVPGDAEAGRAAMARIGCGSCHQIPGVPGAVGMVGPPLDHIASREYLAGVLHNTPDGMITWLRFPQRVIPGNAMPDMNLSELDAHNIAAYLATLK